MPLRQVLEEIGSEIRTIRGGVLTASCLSLGGTCGFLLTVPRCRMGGQVGVHLFCSFFLFFSLPFSLSFFSLSTMWPGCWRACVSCAFRMVWPCIVLSPFSSLQCFSTSVSYFCDRRAYTSLRWRISTGAGCARRRRVERTHTSGGGLKAINPRTRYSSDQNRTISI